MLAAPGSNSGKTTITCALLQALKERGLEPFSFKCGPDYIDPLFHKKVLEIDSRNLDTFFVGENGIRKIMSEIGDSYAVIEGVMGLYDGSRIDSIEGSSYEVAEALDTPIILIVDASGVGRTVISIIKGMLLDDTKHLIKGILLNRISAHFYESLKPVLEKELSDFRPDVKLLGFFPKDENIKVGSRHLGLMLPNEIEDIRKKIGKAAALLEESADVNEIISIMRSAAGLEGKAIEDDRTENRISTFQGNSQQESSVIVKEGSSPLTLAVAYDEAFCFYYRDNLDLFREYGVNIKFFSPLHDETLPEDCDGIFLGGGYPENHLQKLSENKSMLASVRQAIEEGIPSLAECGGFMYLHRSLTDPDGRTYEMVGAIDGECHYTGHLVRFGYMQIEAQKDTADMDELHKSLVGMRGHEFHYYDSSCNGSAYIADKPFADKKWDCMITDKNGIWGFPHFYYRSDPDFIKAFVVKMKEAKHG